MICTAHQILFWEIKQGRMRWAGYVARMEEGRSVYRVLVGKPEGKRPLGRPRRRWEDNVKMDLQEVGCGEYGLARAGSGQGQVAGTCECGNEPSGSIKCGKFLDQLRNGQLLREGLGCIELVNQSVSLLGKADISRHLFRLSPRVRLPREA